jgi:hypothetical protein
MECALYVEKSGKLVQCVVLNLMKNAAPVNTFNRVYLLVISLAAS